MTLYGWVNNADFLPVQSDLWLQLLQLIRGDKGITLATPRQAIELTDGR